MKKLACCCIMILCLISCKKQPEALLMGRWDFTAFDMPGMKNFLEEVRQTGDDDLLTLQKFVLGDKLILRKDSTYDLVMFKQYLHGNWQYDAENKNLSLKDASAAKLDLTVRIDSISPSHLRFDMDEFTLNKLLTLHAADDNAYHLLFNKSYCEFYLNADKDHFSGLKEDPYSVENNRWRMKPAKRETEDEIKQRILNHLSFWQLLFIDAGENKRSYVAYSWFASPLLIAVNGVQLSFYNDVKDEWDQNFYDSADAHRGYELMRKCFSKKIKFMETTDKYRRSEDIIKQLKANFIEATSK